MYVFCMVSAQIPWRNKRLLILATSEFSLRSFFFFLLFPNRVEWMAWLENWNLQKMGGIPMCILKFWGQIMEKILAEASARWGYIYSNKRLFLLIFLTPFLCSMLIEKCLMADNVVLCITKRLRNGSEVLTF